MNKADEYWGRIKTSYGDVAISEQRTPNYLVMEATLKKADEYWGR